MFTRASRLRDAHRMKESGLGIFEDAKKRLNDAVNAFHKHITEANEIIAQKMSEIDAEKASAEAARLEIESATKTIVKINEIIKN